MESARFRRNDEGFVCSNCLKTVNPLKVSSRDHCPHCLCSLHVDVFPGDRKNECCGLLVPVGVHTDSNKGYVIEYRCEKCGETHNNRAAPDDDFETILSVMNGTYKKNKK